MEKIPSLTLMPCSLDEVRQLLQMASGPRCDTSAGLLTLDDACQGAQCFGVFERTALVMAYALRRVQYSGGAATWVTAAAGYRPGLDLTRGTLNAIEQQARDAHTQQVAITTRRPGLIKKLKKQGYEVTGVTLRKTIQ